ncbi:MAG: hypothetical protein R3A79_16005 [Nannocystaceae bacterium]
MAINNYEHRGRPRWISAVALSLPMIAAGCYSGFEPELDEAATQPDPGEDPEPSPSDDQAAPLDGPGECVDSRSFFAEEVFRPVLQAKCFACHNANGAAKNTDFLLQGDDFPGFLEVNYNTLQNIARLEIDGKPLILRKPTLDGVEHGGGLRFEIDSPDYRAMEAMIELFDAPIHCAIDKDLNAFFAGLVLLDEPATLRKGALLLAGRMPTADELTIVREYGEEGLDLILDEMMKEEAFYGRIKDIYNDRLLTDFYLPGRAALEAVDPKRFPKAAELFADDTQKRNWANDAIAREPLNIIENVLRKRAPFTEIVTGDYTMINPYSAQAYGLPVEELGFEDPANPSEYIEHSFEEIPQAGVMTTTAFLGRYPNTPTNRNRARSRYVFDFFLGEDVQQLAARPIDVSAVQATNPTLFDPSCNVCHDFIDPVAGAFQNYSFEGWYRPEAYGNGWYSDMVPPGYNGEEILGEDAGRAVQWLADRIIEDDGFALSVVYTMYEGLTGDKPLNQPLDASDPDYLAKVRAFDAQDASFKELATVFQGSDYDLRELLKAMIKSPWLRAINVEGEVDHDREVELAAMGSARSLSPELLDLKIRAAVGFQWKRGGASALLSSANYKFFYGGIDSINVTTRLTQMNGVMNNIVERMASEVACTATAADLSLPAHQRLLFPEVSLEDEPDGDGEAAIRANLQHLHARILGEVLAADDPEIDRSYQLFTAVLTEGRAGIAAEEYSVTLPGPCQGALNPVSGEEIAEGIIDDPDYKVRAWMSVLSYLLGDYRFLYE